MSFIYSLLWAYLLKLRPGTFPLEPDWYLPDPWTLVPKHVKSCPSQNVLISEECNRAPWKYCERQKMWPINELFALVNVSLQKKRKYLKRNNKNIGSSGNRTCMQNLIAQTLTSISTRHMKWVLQCRIHWRPVLLTFQLQSINLVWKLQMDRTPREFPLKVEILFDLDTSVDV